MIASLRDFLQGNLTSVWTWYQAGTVPSTVKPPFGIIEIGPDRRMVNNKLAISREIRLTVYLPQGSWVAVDETVEEIRRTCHDRVLARAQGGERYRLEWAETTDGWVDANRQAFCRAVVFSVFLRA